LTINLFSSTFFTTLVVLLIIDYPLCCFELTRLAERWQDLSITWGQRE